ncbi:MAG: TMEM175 family protein [Candidatus Margulisiibacteriota bacterium]|nr:DUF1211 domain-containing protein [Candidatus Margulisiibacteriota bacterium]
MTENLTNNYLTTNRIEALTDGIFAIAMTLLALNIDVPLIPSQFAVHALWPQLIALIPSLMNYGLSFVILATFWIVHHQIYHHIKRTDSVTLWLNIIILMFAALIPFTTSLLDDYDSIQIAVVFFECHLFIIGILYNLLWRYSTKDHKLVDQQLPEEHIKRSNRAGLLIPCLSIVAIGISFFTPAWSTLIYALIPFIMIYFRRR